MCFSYRIGIGIYGGSCYEGGVGLRWRVKQSSEGWMVNNWEVRRIPKYHLDLIPSHFHPTSRFPLTDNESKTPGNEQSSEQTYSDGYSFPKEV